MQLSTGWIKRRHKADSLFDRSHKNHYGNLSPKAAHKSRSTITGRNNEDEIVHPEGNKKLSATWNFYEGIFRDLWTDSRQHFTAPPIESSVKYAPQLIQEQLRE